MCCRRGEPARPNWARWSLRISFRLAAVSVFLGCGSPHAFPLALDRPEALVETGPGPGLDLVVTACPDLRLRRLQVLEPGVGLFDEELLAHVLRLHAQRG